MRSNRDVPPLVIRADADSTIGTGHAMRCLALAHAWQDRGGRAVFASGTRAPAVEKRFKAEGVGVVRMSAPPGSVDDSHQLIRLAGEIGFPWIVVDGYHFGSDYQRAIKDAGLRLLFIDDNGHADHYCADIVLNQNLHACESLYPKRDSSTRLLLGSDYVLLRREFLNWQGWKRTVREVARKALVTLGGSDPDNVTLTVIRALQHVVVEGLEAVVVVGGSNPRFEDLQSAARHSRATIRLERDVANMPEWIAWADVAISAGGTTSWELAFMGLPGLVVVLADNQQPVAERLQAAGVALNLGSYKNLSPFQIAHALTSLLVAPKRRAQMAQCALKLIDGDGAGRVSRAMASPLLGLRSANEDDCMLLWRWANDPDVRAAAFQPEPIPWEDHVEWFRKKRSDPASRTYIVEDPDGCPVGQVRCDIQADGSAEVDLSVARDRRGRGYGAAALRLACERFHRDTHVTQMVAYIKPQNLSSLRAFEGAGFVYHNRKPREGHDTVTMVLEMTRGPVN